MEIGDLELPPKITVTAVTGGLPGSYSVVPDWCEVEVDVRLTPSSGAGQATGLMPKLTAELDVAHSSTKPTSVEREPTVLGGRWCFA